MEDQANGAGHSAGPWHYHEHPADDNATAQITNSPAGHGLGLRIADVWATDLPHGAENARLIAAAPDLLLALQEVVAGTLHSVTLSEVVASAIAKAQG